MYSINKKKKKGHVVTGINRIFVLNHCLPFHVKCCLMRSSGLVVMKQLTRFWHNLSCTGRKCFVDYSF